MPPILLLNMHAYSHTHLSKHAHSIESVNLLHKRGTCFKTLFIVYFYTVMRIGGLRSMCSVCFLATESDCIQEEQASRGAGAYLGFFSIIPPFQSWKKIKGITGALMMNIIITG